MTSLFKMNMRISATFAAIYNKQEKAEEIIAEIEADVAKGKQAAAGSEPQRIFDRGKV